MARKLATFEFHVSRHSRDRYQLGDTLFTITGNVIFANFRAARVFAQRMNEQRDLVNYPERAVKPGQINAMGLVDEILHHLVEVYRDHHDKNVMARALTALEESVGPEALDRTLRRFADTFPTVAVYRRETDLDSYLADTTGDTPNRQIVLEELLLLWLANANPAFSPFHELFDDADLRRDTAYPQVIEGLRAFFDKEPRFGPESQNLVAELRAPAIAVPHSLEGQLSYILERWGSLLGKYVYRLLSSLDVIKEERKLIFLGPGPAQVPVYDFTSLGGADGEGAETEAFSAELAWMPSLVLMAKNTYVWMDQLSRKYGRTIDRLDQIPDEELDDLARWGFTGLWLIGVWERSPASQRIKVMCGNPDAVPSAYSLYDYNIAVDLGGEAAYQNLKDRAWQHGIRMASDMVPNHVGIVSRWMMEHPDWFVWREDNPYPWYTYGGTDLSNDDRVGIFIEDHYYDRTDAAVTFKRVDRWTGSERYVYHGNDGTSMPWNDTAQLNYLNPEVREAVIQTILHVARQFPVIRFDAAMTLTKKHFQRLWFPEPGTGGAIPTRAEQGMTRDEFNAAMPAEFWREVVDRVAAEAPDTLLLAEAFWLLEGYFVRTLGMHRVYNSAFMNMLRDEDNAKYRQVMKNTLEFDPEVLRRFVNFMNNPDERTAVDQFGNGDKYFGVCTLMVTMPGLPMFGHGQVEGYAEKYGMEFRRPLWDETPDRGLIERHEREMFPLSRKRPLFAGVENFLLYDFFSPDGTVNEDVFAYSNRLGDEGALVLYHNRYADARGWIRSSAAFAQKTGHGDEKALVQRSLGEGLGLNAGHDWYSIFRDEVTGLEYIRPNQQLVGEGLYVELGAYKRHVFVGFRQVQDTNGQWSQLAGYLDGRGVPSVEEALKEIRLQPVQRPYAALVEPDLLRRLLAPVSVGSEDTGTDLVEEATTRLREFLEQARGLDGTETDVEPVIQAGTARLKALLELIRAQRPAPAPTIGMETSEPPSTNGKPATQATSTPRHSEVSAALLGWALTRPVGELVDTTSPTDCARALYDEWLLCAAFERSLGSLGLDDGQALVASSLTRVLLAHERAFGDIPKSATEPPSTASTRRTSTASTRGPRRVLESLLSDGDVRDFLGINRYRDILWFSQERFEELVEGLRSTELVLLTADSPASPDLATPNALAEALLVAAAQSGYQLERLLGLLRP